MGGVTDMAAFVAGALERTAKTASAGLFVGRSPSIPLRALVTTKNQLERDQAWLQYAKRLRNHGDLDSAEIIFDKLDAIWVEERETRFPPVELELVGHPAREYVEGEYTPPPQPEPTTVEDEELFYALVGQLNLLTTQQILAKWSVKPSKNFEGGWAWTVVAILGTGTRLTRHLTTKQVSQAIDDYIIDTRKESIIP